MKKERKLISLAVALLVLIGAFAGYAPAASAAIDYSVSVISADVIQEAGPPLAGIPASFSVLTPAAPGTRVSRNQKSEIDYSNTRDGYVMVKYLQRTNKPLKVRITGPDSVNYDYNLTSSGSFEVFPLTVGNGSYTVGVFEQIEGSRYSTSGSVTFSVTLSDEFAPYLRPNQKVNFNTNSTVVERATELVRGSSTVIAKVSEVYNFVISNISYDRTFAAEVVRGMHVGYVPNVDSVLERGRGICYDYSALMTSMLRSQGIPTRLVMGYVGADQVYHAWIDVYSSETGWINNVIQFNGRDWRLMDPTFASTSNQSAESIRLIGDGTSYRVRFMY